MDVYFGVNDHFLLKINIKGLTLLAYSGQRHDTWIAPPTTKSDYWTNKNNNNSSRRDVVVKAIPIHYQLEPSVTY